MPQPGNIKTISTEPMRIGILIEDTRNLSNWKLRIIKGIINDPKLELRVLLQEKNIDRQHQKTFLNSFFHWFKRISHPSKFILSVQSFFERKVFFPEKQTVDKEQILFHLKTANPVKVAPQSKGDLVTFGVEDSNKIQELQLDLILKLSSDNLTGETLNWAKHGIWAMEFADSSLNRKGPIGFWEVVLKEPTIGCTLLLLTNDHKIGKVIDRAHFNRHWSFCMTSNKVQEASVSVVFKNIRKLMQGEPLFDNPTAYNHAFYKFPEMSYVLKYLVHFCNGFAKKTISNISFKLFGLRYECWTLYLGKGDFLNTSEFAFEAVKLPKGEFWADPFLFNHQDIDYVFFENYSYKTKRGKISCGKVVNNQIKEVVDVLDFDYHLSFPFVFEEKGDIFLMPETMQNKRLEIYKCLKFPTEWCLYTTAFEGERVVDAHFYNDNQGQKWLFLNKKAALTSPANSELFIYKVDSIKLRNLQPHIKNPVLIDARVARNAGSIFKYGDDLYRPSQRNIDGIYGRALNINKIEKLTLEDYEERTVKIIKPDFDNRLMAMHHFHQLNDLFVFDAAYERI